MSNGFIYVVAAHFIDKIEEKKFLDPCACVCMLSHPAKKRVHLVN
jgi:hypothetical protein